MDLIALIMPLSITGCMIITIACWYCLLCSLCNDREVAEEIIKSEKWMNALASATVAEQTDGTKIADTPLRKLIRKMPGPVRGLSDY